VFLKYDGQNRATGEEVGQHPLPLSKNVSAQRVSTCRTRNVSNYQGRSFLPRPKDVFLTWSQKASNRVQKNQIKNKLRTPPSQGGSIGAFPPFDYGSHTAPAFPAAVPGVMQSPTGNLHHPFTSRGRASFRDVSFHNVERVELTTLQSEVTGG
jgi:hypothetical protein